MSKELTLAKAVVINNKNTLGEEFAPHYFPEADMYIFFCECTYDSINHTYTGTRMMHDRILAKNSVPKVPSDTINYISIDIKPDDKEHTYMKSNRRGYQLTKDQKSYVARLFNVDYF